MAIFAVSWFQELEWRFCFLRSAAEQMKDGRMKLSNKVKFLLFWFFKAIFRFVESSQQNYLCYICFTLDVDFFG